MVMMFVLYFMFFKFMLWMFFCILQWLMIMVDSDGVGLNKLQLMIRMEMFLGFMFVFLKSLFKVLNMMFLVFVLVFVMLGFGGVYRIVGGKQVLFLSLDFLMILCCKLMFFGMNMLVVMDLVMKFFVEILLLLEFEGLQQVQFMRQMGYGCVMQYRVMLKMSVLLVMRMLMRLNFSWCYRLLMLWWFRCWILVKMVSIKGSMKGYMVCEIMMWYFSFMYLRFIVWRKFGSLGLILMLMEELWISGVCGDFIVVKCFLWFG